MISDEPGRLRSARQRSLVLAALAAIPFWAAVGYLDPLAALRPAAPRPLVEVRPPRSLPPLRCREFQDLHRQSLRDCTPWIRARPTPSLGPGDYPLRPDPDPMMAGHPSPPSGS